MKNFFRITSLITFVIIVVMSTSSLKAQSLYGAWKINRVLLDSLEADSALHDTRFVFADDYDFLRIDPQMNKVLCKYFVSSGKVYIKSFDTEDIITYYEIAYLSSDKLILRAERPNTDPTINLEDYTIDLIFEYEPNFDIRVLN
jgi:hypothetical protein